MAELFFSDGIVARKHGHSSDPAYLGDFSDACSNAGLNPNSPLWAWELIRLQSGLDDQAQKDLVVMVLVSMIAHGQGSTRLPLTQTEWTREAATPFVDDADAWLDRLITLIDEQQVEDLVGGPEDAVPFIIDGGWLYHHRIHYYEARFAELLQARPVVEVSQDVDAALDEVLELPAGSVVLDDDQRQAVRLAASQRLSVITGGPGTGKTSVVVSVLRTLVRLGVDPATIALAAPTGKAANRLGESIDTQLVSIQDPSEIDMTLTSLDRPQTIHRLLQFSRRTGKFIHSERNPLEHDWVIIDEASMIDLVLMQHLLSSVRADANIVFLGDAEQLPSVDTGTILRDLVPEEGAKNVVRLQTSHRVRDDDPESAKLLNVASLVRQGDDAALLSKTSPLTTGEAARGVGFIELTEEENTLRPMLVEWEERTKDVIDNLGISRVYHVVGGEFAPDDLEDLNALFEAAGANQILCLTKVLPTGTRAINAYFHRRLAIRSGLSTSLEFLPGEPVMIQTNDYDRGLFNGDQGLVIRATVDAEEERLVAVFRQGATFRAYHLSSLRSRLDLAFAITVHKSQGSEYDDVLLILPVQPIPLLTREIIYTAITRAKTSAQIIGPLEQLRTGVQRRVTRFSGVRSRLAAGGQGARG